jgi:hypothetical protein
VPLDVISPGKIIRRTIVPLITQADLPAFLGLVRHTRVCGG